MHPLLRRQLKKLGLAARATPTQEEWTLLLERVDQTYAQADQDRSMIERSLEQSSEEMQQLYDELRSASAAELSKKSAELASSLALARAVQDSVADGILVVNAQGQTLSCNQRFQALWDLPQADLDCAGLIETMSAKVKHREAFVARAREGLADTEGVGIQDVELLDGRIFERFSAPVRAGGPAAGVRVVCYRDVTEQRRLTTERMVVSERMAAVGQLVASVAHEINNPLSYVLGNVELVYDALAHSGDPKDVELVEALDDVRIGVDRIRVIVRDLGTLSRASEHASEPVDVVRVLHDALQVASTQLRHRARVVRDLAPVPLVLANESRLTQVFLNLLVNAAQAIPEGRASDNAVTISTRLAAADRVRVEIRDTGSGIAPEHLERIFDPFFTTKAIGEGTGLGLSICRGLVEKLGGTIVVESVVGKGSCFVVELPVALPEESPQPVAAPEPVTASPRRRILVIDDDDDVRRVLQRILAKDHDVLCVANVSDARAAIASGTFDVVLCDVMMPDQTGKDLYALVQRERPDLASRLVFMTGGVFTPALHAFLESIPNERLEKPLRLEDVRSMIERVGARS